MELPKPEIHRACLLAAETLVEKNHVLIFDHFELLLDGDGKPHADVLLVVDHIASLSGTSKVPCYLLSRRVPKLSVAIGLKTGFVRVNGIDTTHIVTILESEASRISRHPFKSNTAQRSLAEHLFGYPLAGRLAAPLVVKYSPEFLLENLLHITSLKRDIAEAILANTGFSDTQARLLQILAICDGSLSVVDLAAVSGIPADAVVGDIDILADHNLLDADGSLVRLHPLVSDFYWKQARGARDFRSLVSRIADYAQQILKNERPDTVKFVSWLSTACRALFLSDRGAEATKLRRDFTGELKLAAIELYQRGDYGISLRYCDEFLAQEPDDFEVNFHRARNLSRVGKHDESLKVIDRLLEITKSRFQRARLHFARGRVFWETRNGDLARAEFLKAIEINPSSLPALQGVSEVLLTQGRIDDASGFIERALKISPMDSFSLSMKADIYWRRGEVKNAVR
jgi:tetratricopeptide (TPR) repeat protein